MMENGYQGNNTEYKLRSVEIRHYVTVICSYDL
jgi:hypothetical protein